MSTPTKTRKPAAAKTSAPASPEIPSAIAFADLPAIGAPLAGGLYAGVTNDAAGAYHAVVLLPDAPPKHLAWKAAVAWAAKLGAGAQLPNRPVAALLYFNLRSQFDLGWHWLCDELDGSDAWLQLFNYGCQNLSRKSYEGCARAVRLIPLNPSILRT